MNKKGQELLMIIYVIGVISFIGLVWYLFPRIIANQGIEGYLLMMSILGIFLGSVYVLGEKFGWRGGLRTVGV